MLRELVSNGKANVFATNSVNQRPIDLLATRQDPASLAFLQTFTPVIASTISTRVRVLGGEDTSDLVGVLKDTIDQWNATLPPFDMDFYTTVCCDPTFEQEYHHMQSLSQHVQANPHDCASLKRWQQSLAKWRIRLLVVYGALMDPSGWSQQQRAFTRAIPPDLSRQQDAIANIWQANPTKSRARLDHVNALFTIQTSG